MNHWSFLPSLLFADHPNTQTKFSKKPLSREKSTAKKMMNPIPNDRAAIARNRPQRCTAALRDCMLCFYGVAMLLSFCYLTPFLLFNSHLTPPKLCREEDSIYHSEKEYETKYAEMEREMKVFVYPDGKLSSGKHGGERLFFKNIMESRFLTHDPEKADLFFIPISCHQIRRPKGVKYLERLINEYPYWNKTWGKDHFFVDCQDDIEGVNKQVPEPLHISIRVMCSSRYDSCYLRRYSSLGFMARHRYLGPRVASEEELVNAWKPSGVGIQSTHIDTTNGSSSLASLIFKFKSSKSKFFICSPGTAHAHTVCLAHSIHYGCVPVIMSDYSEVAFDDVLNWFKFAVMVRFQEKGGDDIIQLTQILTVISSSEFHELQSNTIKAGKHLQWNSPPIKYDAFHMVMYELWLKHTLYRY